MPHASGIQEAHSKPDCSARPALSQQQAQELHHTCSRGRGGGGAGVLPEAMPEAIAAGWHIQEEGMLLAKEQLDSSKDILDIFAKA